MATAGANQEPGAAGAGGAFGVVVVGASAGGLDALRRLVAGFPADLPAAVFIVQHLYRESVSLLPDLLAQAGLLPAKHPRHGETIRPGVIYVAPPDYHMLLDQPGVITLDRGPRENMHRPAIDPLFRSAARTYGPLATGIILSGSKDDGALGMLALRMYGGHTIVQEPSDAAYSEMPQSVLDQVEGIDHVVPVAAMPELVVDLVRKALQAHAVSGSVPNRRSDFMPGLLSNDGARAERGGRARSERSGEGAMPTNTGEVPSGDVDPLATEPDVFICPECGGALQMEQQGQLVRYRCHTGHAFGMKSLDMAYAERVEYALWAAMSALKERTVLSRRMAEHVHESRLVEEYRRQADEAHRQARVIEDLLSRFDPQHIDAAPS